MKNPTNLNIVDADFFAVQGQFGDVDQLVEVVREWNFDFFQIGRGAFDGHLLQAGNLDFQIGEGRFGRSLEQHGAPPSWMRTFVVPADPALELRWRRHGVTGDQLMIFPRRGELHSISDSRFHVYTISFREDVLVRAGEKAGFPEVADALESGKEVVAVEPGEMAELAAACRAIAKDPYCLCRPAGHESLAALLARVLVCSTDVPSPAPPSGLRRRALQKALELAAEKDHHPLTVEQICEHAEVSARTLQYAFREEFGISPKGWAQARALNEVRKQLRRANPQDTRIVDVANEWGFWHMGKFAADYRRLFGELPSEALKGTRGRS